MPHSSSADQSDQARTTPPVKTGIYSLWRLRGYLRPYLGTWITMLVTALLGVLASLTIPLVTRAVIDGPIEHGDAGAILPLGLLALALGIAEAALMFTRRWIQARAVLGFETHIRNDLYEHIQGLPMQFHAQWQSGQLLSRITFDLTQLRRFMGFGMLFLVINVLQLVVVTVLLLKLYWPLGLVVAISAIPIILVSHHFQTRYVKISRREQDQQGDVATAVEEAALGFRVTKSFGRQQHIENNFEDNIGTLYGTSMQKVKLSARFWTFLEVIPNVSLVVVLLLGALAVGHHALTLGTLVAFITLMLQLVWPIESLGFILAMAQEAMTAADRVHNLFDTKPDVVGGSRDLNDVSGHLRFDHVDFSFPDDNVPVLRDVNLDVLPGETVAVVGATGSGKSALVSLVPRLYDVTSGHITIDDVDVRDLTLPSLRRLTATAFEKATLFSMSARENITLGRPDASEDDIDEAIQTAQAGFVYDLPWGLDTRIGEQGMALSGGQRQRLALARAVLAQPRVLVLDDTLSALDVHTEALVESALRQVLADATGIVVAHRASTVMLADKVALLDAGTITHVGSHHELLETVPLYRDLLAGDADTEDIETADRRAEESERVMSR